MQIILKLQAPQKHARASLLEFPDGAGNRAAHIDDRARRFASHLVEIAQIAFDQRIERSVSCRLLVASQSLRGCRAMASRRCGSAMCM